MIMLRLFIIISVAYSFCCRQVSGFTTRFYNEFHNNEYGNFRPKGFCGFGPNEFGGHGHGFNPYEMEPPFGPHLNEFNGPVRWPHFHPVREEENFITPRKVFSSCNHEIDNILDDLDEMEMAASSPEFTSTDSPIFLQTNNDDISPTKKKLVDKKPETRDERHRATIKKKPPVDKIDVEPRQKDRIGWEKYDEKIPELCGCEERKSTDEIDLKNLPDLDQVQIMSDIKSGRLKPDWLSKAYAYVNCLLSKSCKYRNHTPCKSNHFKDSIYNKLVRNGNMGEEYDDNCKHIPKDEKKSYFSKLLSRNQMACRRQSPDTVTIETSPFTCKLELQCGRGNKLQDPKIYVIDCNDNVTDFYDLNVRQKHLVLEEGLKDCNIFVCYPAKIKVNQCKSDLAEIMLLKSVVIDMLTRCTERFFDTNCGQAFGKYLCDHMSLT